MTNLIGRAISAEELRIAVDSQGLIPELVAPLDHLLQGQGKQLRATLVQTAALAGAGDSSQAVREGATAVELLHLGSLAHDDVVDDARLRRGREAVGIAYGNRASAFAGGVLLASAGELISHHGEKPTNRFAEAVAAICEGEMAEVEDLFQTDRSIERYFQAISGKTAAGFAFAGWLGAWLAGTDADVVLRVSRFGHQMGMAFQVLDDILDLSAPVQRTGKQRGKDLQQGVYTLPVLYALIADQSLRRKLGQPIDAGEAEHLVEEVISTGGIDKAVEDCRSFADQARAALNEVPDEPRNALLELLHTALEPLGQAAPTANVSYV